MKTFRQFCEGSYPKWTRSTVMALVFKIATLEDQISKEEDPKEREMLLAKQNKLLAYITGLSIAIDTSDTSLAKRMSMGKTK